MREREKERDGIGGSGRWLRGADGTENERGFRCCQMFQKEGEHATVIGGNNPNLNEITMD